MDAIKPTLSPAIQAVTEYVEKQRDNLSREHVEIMHEIRRRLEKLEAQAAELININNRLLKKQGINVDFDSTTDTITFSVGGMNLQHKLNRAEPDIPMKVTGLLSGSAYHAGTLHATNEEEHNLQIELEEKLESYYQSAHRVLKLFGRMSCLSKIRCVAISRVRNELIEHPDDGALYTFGVGSSGPRVKPMHRGAPKFNDEGLVPNTLAFVEAIAAWCKANVP